MINQQDHNKKQGHNMLLYFAIVILFLLSSTVSRNKAHLQEVEKFERKIETYGIERLVSPEGHYIYFIGEDKVIIK